MEPYENNPEERFKTLINIGIAVSIVIFIGIFITIGITKTRIALRQTTEAMDEMFDQMAVDTATYSDDVIDDYVAPDDYYTKNPDDIKSENDLLRQELRNKCYQCKNQDALLDHLESQAQHCAELTRELRHRFEDTLNNAGVRHDYNTTAAFFRRTAGEEELFSALFLYRETAEELMVGTSIEDPISYRMYLPLMESNQLYESIETWNQSIFEGEPDEAVLFLKQLESDIRYYDHYVLSDILN